MKERDRITLELLEIADSLILDHSCTHKLLYKNRDERLGGTDMEDIYLTRTKDNSWVVFLYDPYELNITLVGMLPVKKPNFRGASLQVVLDFFEELVSGHFERLLFSMYFDSAYAFMRDDVAALIGTQESRQRITK